VPVWHEKVKDWVEKGELVFIGITQEQHPDRCRLFAQWKGFDFPILWDAFNLTDSKVVPNFIAIDEHGIVRSTRPRRASFEEDFLAVAFEAPKQAVEPDFEAGACSFSDLHEHPSPISALSQHKDLDASVTELEKRASADPEDAQTAFHAGVAHRLRYDSPEHRPSDFQSAIDHWTRALLLDPNQYIWRRRIQQYGPRMDKPYPFYTWTEQAREEILARGESPVVLLAELTGAELAEPRRGAPPATDIPDEPDPKARIHRDEVGLIEIESATAFDTSGKQPIASVHISLRTNRGRKAHWNHEAGPLVEVWVDAPTPRLMRIESRDDVATSEGLQLLNFEIELPAGETEMILPSYALYYVCEGEAGKCVYLRQEFEILIQQR